MTFKDTKLEVEKVYKKVLPKLQSYLYRLTCDRELANDLSHDTFIKVIEKKQQFKGHATAETWIFAIATNLATDHLRKKKRWPETAQDEARKLAESDDQYRKKFLTVNRQSPYGTFDIKEHIDFCFTCISKTLPVEQQVTLILKDIYDFKVAEISVILESPHGTIKHWLFEARKKMTAIFDRRCALVNKNGPCHQCSELNGVFNPKQKKQEDILRKKNIDDKQAFYDLRANLVKAIDPLNSGGNDLEYEIMKVLRKAIDDR